MGAEMMFLLGLQDANGALGVLSQADVVLQNTRTWLRAAGPEGWLTMGGAGLFAAWLWNRRPW